MFLATFRDLELKILHWINCDGRGGFADVFAQFVNSFLSGVHVFLLLFLISVVSKRGRERFPRVLVTLLLTMGFVHGTRAVLWRTVPRDRPGKSFTEAQILRGGLPIETCASQPEKWVEHSYPPTSPSFPSSHTVTGGACAIALTFASPWLGAAGWIYAALEGWGRMYWGKHWPSDVVGSLVLSALLGIWAWRLAPRVLSRIWRRGTRLPSTSPADPPVPRG